MSWGLPGSSGSTWRSTRGIEATRSLACVENAAWASSIRSGDVSPSFQERRTTQVIKKAVAGCDGVLTALVPGGVHHYSSGTAQAVLDHARPGARLIFSCGWHIARDGKDVYPDSLKREEKLTRWFGRLTRMVDINDQVEACRRIFASDTRWTVVRGSDLEEGESQGRPVWSKHVGDPVLESNITRRVDYALFMVAALENDDLVHEAPAIVGCQTPSALAFKAGVRLDLDRSAIGVDSLNQSALSLLLI